MTNKEIFSLSELGGERYKNLPEDEKQRPVEYRKNIIKYGKKITNKEFLVSTFISLLKTLLSFASIKDNGALFKSHLK